MNNDNPNNADDGDVKPTTKTSNNGLIFGIVGAIVGVIVILAIIIVVILIKRRRNNESTAEYSNSQEAQEEPVVLSTTEDVDAKTVDNPLWTSDLMDDTDVFNCDFEENEYYVP